MHSQDSTVLSQVSPKFLQSVAEKAGQLDNKLERKANGALEKMRREDLKIAKKLFKSDSAKAKELLSDIDNKYDQLEKRLNNLAAGNYIASLDTLYTSLKFLEQNHSF